jgi:hypothetical protein
MRGATADAGSSSRVEASMTEFPEIGRLRQASRRQRVSGYVPLSDAERAVRDAVERAQGETVGIANAARREAVRECVETLRSESAWEAIVDYAACDITHNQAAADFLERTMLGGESPPDPHLSADHLHGEWGGEDAR